MKKQMLLIIPIVILTVFACRKYKEDSFISLKSQMKRLQGAWHVEYFEVNGSDSTQVWQNSNGMYNKCDLYFYHYEGEYRYEFCRPCCHDYTYNFKGDNIEMIDWFTYPRQNILNNISVEILKLYKNNWWISYKNETKNYFIKLKKISQ